MDFTKLFNARTAKYVEGIQLPVKLRVFSDRSFEFDIATPVIWKSRLRLLRQFAPPFPCTLCCTPPELPSLYASVRLSQPTSWFLKRAAGIEKGANSPGKEVAG
eukprot:COSAG01_NODE_1133_length_11566_cov_25.815819_11_plen_104_part_00